MGLPQQWNNWLVTNLLKGVDPHSLLNTLLDNGFSFELAKRALGNNLPEHISHPRDGAFFERLMQPPGLTKVAAETLHYIDTPLAQLVVIDNFLPDDLCDELVALAKSQLRPSEIASEGDQYEGFRTSSTCDLPFLNHPSADLVDQKIIECLGLGVGEMEIIQAQHYSVGQQFKAHTDYFEPGSDEYRRFSKDGGQRTWTFMVYLNDVEAGGETEFVKLGERFTPSRGTALAWNNLHADGSPNTATLHHAHPVKAGEKVVITKWFRESTL